MSCLFLFLKEIPLLKKEKRFTPFTVFWNAPLFLCVYNTYFLCCCCCTADYVNVLTVTQTPPPPLTLLQTTNDVIFTNSVSNFCCNSSSYCCYYIEVHKKPPEQKIPFKYYYIPHGRWIPCIIFLPRRLYLKKALPQKSPFLSQTQRGKKQNKQKTKSSLWFFIIIVSPWSEGILQRNYTKIAEFEFYFI